MAGKIYACHGGFIDDIDKFDPLFFNVSPREAEMMDPQLRWLLQVSWNALEDAGYSMDFIQNTRTGVYIGNCFNDYQDILKQNSQIDYQFASVNANSNLANRLSYFLDITGPSLSLDTACSSSLVALHLACQSLRSGECEYAFVGGVNLNVSPYKYLMGCAMSAFSESDHLNPFDESADGYLPGESVVVLLLKPLSQALIDNDRIHGVIKGSAVNAGGKASGPTVPNPERQTQVIIDAWQNADINPETIGYLEAHGTGTRLGDPLEIDAIKRAFGQFTHKTQFCALGTIKGNIGHTEAVAGLAGIIKVLLQMKHGFIPILPRLKTLNKIIELQDSPIYINKEIIPWVKSPLGLRRGAVSSFGIGGTYAHVVVEEAPESRKLLLENHKPYYLLTLSAKHPDPLRQRMIDLQNYLDIHSDLSLEAVAYTLNLGRSHFNYRCALVVDSIEELQLKLKKVLNHEKLSGYFFGESLNEEWENKAVNNRVLNETMQKLNESLADIEQYKECLYVLADLYAKGCELDWMVLHCQEANQKITLPTYPFLKKRYWFQSEKLEEETIGSSKVKLQSFKELQASMFIVSPSNELEMETNTFGSLLKNKLSLESVKEKLKILFKESLCLENLADTETFNNLGIDSILGAELTKKINLHFGINIKASKLYDFTNIRSLASHLIDILEQHIDEESSKAVAEKPIELKKFDSKLSLNLCVELHHSPEGALAFSQERLWLLAQINKQVKSYNIPLILKLKEEVKVEVLSKSLKLLVDRHDALRTRIKLDENFEPVQYIEKNIQADLSIETIHSLNEHKLMDYIDKYINYSFTLNEDENLFLFHLVEIEKGGKFLIIVLHHLIFDVMSSVIFLNKLLLYYQGILTNQNINLPPLTFTYLKFVQWQRAFFTPTYIEKQKAYWKERLSLMVPVKWNLPNLERQEKEQSTDHYKVYFNKLSVMYLKDIANNISTSMFTVCYALFQITLSKLTGNTDITMAVPYLARDKCIGAENVIGYFAEPLPIRCKLILDNTMTEFMLNVKDLIVEAYENFLPTQFIPFPKLNGANPFNIFFTFISQGILAKNKAHNMLFSEKINVPMRMNFDIFCIVVLEGPQLELSVSYNSGIFPQNFIKSLCEIFESLIHTINKDLSITLAECIDKAYFKKEKQKPFLILSDLE